jgi:phage terminase large subunit-like protein
MPTKQNIERVLDHTFEAENTYVHFIMTHEIQGIQRKTCMLLHGQDVNIELHNKRFNKYDKDERGDEKNFHDFMRFFLRLCQRKDTAAVYFVCPARWKRRILDKYLEKINGTTIGWFVGFGDGDIDDFKSVEKILTYRYRYTWLDFPMNRNFHKNNEAIKRKFKTQ